MRVKHLVAAGALLLLLALAIPLFRSRAVDLSGAEHARIKYDYEGERVDAKVSDEDFTRLLKILNGRRIVKDHPSCGFSEDISIVFAVGDAELILSPACDGCPKFQINGSDRYAVVSDEERKEFDAIALTYGMKFPCV